MSLSVLSDWGGHSPILGFNLPALSLIEVHAVKLKTKNIIIIFFILFFLFFF
tara:strand:- start:906 stop:1061 length:156 start_codon:yes stop_codon:yes gene_type:complete